tara:strand:+ start:2488 stop:3624 length:1137 start_codon:yes stop_codon:yes gene_type:complete
MIKFWSYQTEYKKIRKKLLRSIDNTIKNGSIFFGKELETFEKNFIKSNKAKYGVAVGSGTDAILIALKTLNIKNDDEVITVSNTAIPTISAIINVGAKPKFADIGDDFLIDVKTIEKQINSKTKAIIPVHLYGQSCDMDSINSLAKKYNLKVIEDCAQAQGAQYKGKFVGTLGDFGCFSFYPTKILGAYGDGGFILTKDFNLYKKIKRQRFYGIETIDKKNKFFNGYYANENGMNSRLDEIQSTILNIKLSKIDSYISLRRKISKIYLKSLKDTNLLLPNENNKCKHVYHLFTIYHPKGDLILKKLNEKKIQVRKIYPYPIHKMKAYKIAKKNYKKSLKNTEEMSKGIFCLPLYPELNIADIKEIIKSLKDILQKNNW